MKAKFPDYQSLSKTADALASPPKFLIWDDLFEQYQNKNTENQNSNYEKIINLFVTSDLKGYRQDERFANLMDDSLHCFYAAHCDYFVTIDRKCADKSKKVFQILEIYSKVLSPPEFLNEYPSTH